VWNDYNSDRSELAVEISGNVREQRNIMVLGLALDLVSAYFLSPW